MTDYMRKRTTRGNALTEGTRQWFLGHRLDDCLDRGVPRHEVYREQLDLQSLNNAKFRQAFIAFYGKDWWDDCMAGH